MNWTRVRSGKQLLLENFSVYDIAADIQNSKA